MSYLLSRLNYVDLTNDAYAQYHLDLDALFVKTGPGVVGIKTIYDARYHPALKDIVADLDPVRESKLTGKINEQDKLRDNLYRYLVMIVKATRLHYNPTMADAARDMQVLVDNYGNITRKSYDKASAALDDFLRELDAPKNAALVATIGLTECVTRLAAANATFIALMRERYGEVLARPTSHMKAARVVMDAAFRALLNRVEAIVTLNGMDFVPEMATFIAELNAITDRYKHILATERGRRAARKPGENEEVDNAGTNEDRE
ncbi:MAG: DUF6261 family protein [Odoribacteraceae bacterium]|jgi:hypothetical protein|nr:DUF6261 family protein [Odoribacteraceae bacterium]